MTQNNLGNALWRLGERESGTVRLEEAVSAYREALKEYTHERVPLQWAKAIEAAFDVFMQAGQEHHRSYFEDRLGELDRQIAKLTPPW